VSGGARSRCDPLGKQDDAIVLWSSMFLVATTLATVSLG
jgi:hypothetical protein